MFSLPLLSPFLHAQISAEQLIIPPSLRSFPLCPSVLLSIFPFSFALLLFPLLLYASPLVSMGTRFGRGVVLMISPTWWNFVTFLTPFSDSVFLRVLIVSSIIKR